MLKHLHRKLKIVRGALTQDAMKALQDPVLSHDTVCINRRLFLAQSLKNPCKNLADICAELVYACALVNLADCVDVDAAHQRTQKLVESRHLAECDVGVR